MNVMARTKLARGEECLGKQRNVTCHRQKKMKMSVVGERREEWMKAARG